MKQLFLIAARALLIISQSSGVIVFSRREPHEHHIDKILKIFDLSPPNRRLSDQQCVREHIERFAGIDQPERFPPIDNSDHHLVQCPDVSQSCCDKQALGEIEHQFKATEARLKRLFDFAANINAELLKTTETLPKIVRKMWKEHPNCFDEKRAESVEASFKIFYAGLPTLTESLRELFAQTTDAYSHVPCFLCDVELVSNMKKDKSDTSYTLTLNYKNFRLMSRPFQLFLKILVPLAAMAEIAKEFTCEIKDKFILASAPSREEIETLQAINIKRLQAFESNEFTQEAQNCYNELFNEDDWFLWPKNFAFIYEFYIIAFEYLGEYHKFNNEIMMKFEAEDFLKRIKWMPDRLDRDSPNKKRSFTVVLSADNTVDLSKYKLVKTDAASSEELRAEHSAILASTVSSVALICLMLW